MQLLSVAGANSESCSPKMASNFKRECMSGSSETRTQVLDVRSDRLTEPTPYTPCASGMKGARGITKVARAPLMS